MLPLQEPQQPELVGQERLAGHVPPLLAAVTKLALHVCAVISGAASKMIESIIYDLYRLVYRKGSCTTSSGRNTESQVVCCDLAQEALRNSFHITPKLSSHPGVRGEQSHPSPAHGEARGTRAHDSRFLLDSYNILSI